MNAFGCDVTVTSPHHIWMGSCLERRSPPLLTVLVGKKIEEETAPEDGADDDVVERIRRRSRKQDIVVLFFEQNDGVWKDIPVERQGIGPYKVSELLTINFFNAVRGCKTAEEQKELLKVLGLAIDDEFVGC